MEAVIPIIDASSITLTHFVNKLHPSSIHGLKVELQDDKDPNAKYMCVFMPTLSSMFFSLVDKKDSLVEYHEEAPPFRRRPLSVELLAQLEIQV